MNKVTKVEYHAINTREKDETTDFVFRVRIDGVDGWELIKAVVDTGKLDESFRAFEGHFKKDAAAVALPRLMVALGLDVPDGVMTAATAAYHAIEARRREALRKQFATYRKGEAAFKAAKANAADKSWLALFKKCNDMIATASIVADVIQAEENDGKKDETADGTPAE